MACDVGTLQDAQAKSLRSSITCHSLLAEKNENSPVLPQPGTASGTTEVPFSMKLWAHSGLSERTAHDSRIFRDKDTKSETKIPDNLKYMRRISHIGTPPVPECLTIRMPAQSAGNPAPAGAPMCLTVWAAGRLAEAWIVSQDQNL